MSFNDFFDMNRPRPVPIKDFVANFEKSLGIISGSIPVDAKNRRHLNLLGAGNEHERFRKIYEKLFFWEFFHTRPIPVPSEQKVNEIITTLKRKLDPSQLCDLGWGQVTDASNDFLRYEVGSKDYDEYWNNEERLEMISPAYR
jgi:hypothetical protein